MGIEDHPAFPRLNYVAMGLKESEDRLFDAIGSGDKNKMDAAKLEVMAALEAYKQALYEIDFDDD